MLGMVLTWVEKFDNPFHFLYTPVHFEYWVFVRFHVINTFKHVLFFLIFIYYMVYWVIFMNYP